MNSFIYVFIICIVLIAVIIAIAAMLTRHEADDDATYRDENGRHTYYERSIIEKDDFHRKNPDVPYSEIRSLRRLLRLGRKKN